GFPIRRAARSSKSFLRLQPRLAHALKGFNVSAQKKSAIVKAERNPAVVPELDNFADLTSQRNLGSPGESLSDQPDLIANFETGVWLRFLLHFALAFSPSSTRRLSDPNLCREGSSIPSFSARWRIAFSLRHRRFDIAAILAPNTAAARS
ncbi:MAG TPA: hypothetical protein VF396_24695, partial [Bradyrhizobium sp.]